MQLIETARAKINLSLRVRGRRPDGYHELASLVAFADVGDRVALSVGAPPSVSVKGKFAAAIQGENIAARALAELAARAPHLKLGAIQIDKELPVAAGIGGGSADAAAVLRAVRRANEARAEDIDWQALATSLGADVPVCLNSTAQFMWGIGEHTAAVAPIPPLAVLLVNPGVPLATAAVFRALNAPALESGSSVQPPEPFKDAAGLLAYVRSQGNDLEPIAQTLCPEVGAILAALRDLPGLALARMSGSGPTCFGIFETPAAAAAAQVSLRQSAPEWWVVASTLH